MPGSPRSEQSTETKILVALSRSEIDQFLPEPLWSELAATGAQLDVVDISGVESRDYSTIILDHRPQIILSAWETPPLEEASAEQLLESLRYNCHLCGAVRRKIPRRYLEHGLLVTNWGSEISSSVAEAALLLILSALRRSTSWALRMHVEKEWDDPSEPVNEGLFGKRLGLHGLGSISRALVDLVRPFGVSIQAYSPSVADHIFDETGVSRADSLEELFGWSEILVELAANKPANHHIVNEKLLRMLPPGGVFVNVGRGAVVDEEALVRVAGEGELQVGLDVYEEEPLPSVTVEGMRNVTLLPHIGGPTRDRLVGCGGVAVDNVGRYLAGRPLQNLVTGSIYDRIT